jgi:cyclophilin family peptidyl-prolyl cis-trans isomerase/HEAT repeat protein
MRRTGWFLASWLICFSACGPTPPPKLPAPAAVPEPQKMAWILQLEDQRLLHLDLPAPEPPPPPVKGRKPKPVAIPPKPSSSPDLAVLVRDTDPRIRRRAALAIGRVKSTDGMSTLAATLTDTDPDVRAMAAFALGIIGDSSAESALTPLLTDAAPMVRGRAAEALGQIGAKGAAAAIGQMVAGYVTSVPVAAMQADADASSPEATALALGLNALVRLKAYEPMASAVVADGQPASAWWPVAYALQRVEDPRAAPVLVRLLGAQGRYARAFAARGLGVLKEPSAVKPLVALLEPSAKSPLEVTISVVRALGQIGSSDAAPSLIPLLTEAGTHPNVRLEAVTALGSLHATDALPAIQDLMTDDWPSMRAVALRAAAAIDQDSFVAVLAGMEPDRHWRVRAALADTLGTLPPAIATERLRSMLQDEDKRVIPSVLSSLVRLKADDLKSVVVPRLEDPDFAVRAAAATAVGRLKIDDGAQALRDAFKRAESDSAYGARTAALEALVEYGAAEATETVRAALQDKEWAVRVRADELLSKLEPNGPARTIAPVPQEPITPYNDPELIAPTNSPHVFIETAYGTIEFELAVLDAPQTCRNFIALVSKGFFNGLEVHRVVGNFVVQDGDPRGDGEGGPGYTIRDELNDRPYLRGTVGMALEWRDTGGSQFFITHSPQPHLDGRYTVFGHVVNGMEVVDRIKPGDVIQRVRVWDGTGWKGTW